MRQLRRVAFEVAARGTPTDKKLNPTTLASSIAAQWDNEIVPLLTDYIAIPAKSPHFDPQWVANGHIERVIRTRGNMGTEASGARPGDRDRSPAAEDTPALLRHPWHWRSHCAVLRSSGQAARDDRLAARIYGPWNPLYEDGKLYGRGGADDGYAVFASLRPSLPFRRKVAPHARCVGIIETCEESGSYDLPAYLEALAPRMGRVDFVIGLDSGCGDYERLWATTSLRGMAGGTLKVDVLTEGVHSGDASGVVPSSFRIARKLLDRLEDAGTGKVLPSAFHAPIPAERIEQAKRAAAILGNMVIDKFPFDGTTGPMVTDRAEALLNRTWRPALSVIGADGFPAIADAGNVLRPSTSLRLSLRLPPPIDGDKAAKTLKHLLEIDPPYGATVHFESESGATGWNAPPTAPWLSDAIEDASSQFYQKPAAAMGEGGTIPFMAMLGKYFPDAQFLITGVLGPHSNAHGPNEFLHVPYAKKLTACVAAIIAAHSRQG